MTGAAVYLLLGLSLLLAIVLPQLTHRIPVSPPMVLVARRHGHRPAAPRRRDQPRPAGPPHALITPRHHVTEFTVLVSLMGVGLAIDRTLDPRSWRSWRTWSPVWRLLLVTMPLTILGIALLGWWVAGLAPAVALLLGAALAPTDPVLASDVQVGEPLTEDVDDGEGDRDEDARDEDDDIRFSLTAEAGLNDGLAFPFVHLALLLLAGGFGLADAGGWLGWYVVGKIAARRRSSAWPSAGCWAARPSAPAATSSAWPTTASRCWRWPRCWRRTAPRSWSAATASSRSSSAR